MIFDNCYYCGASPSNVMHYSNGKKIITYYTGVDRVDNSKGYIPGNCVPACGFCNKAKNNQSLEEFLDWLNALKMNCQKVG